MERQFGTAWRRSVGDMKFFQRRFVIISELIRLIEYGTPERLAIRQLETKRQLTPSKSLSALAKTIKSEAAAREAGMALASDSVVRGTDSGARSEVDGVTAVAQHEGETEDEQMTDG
jgi:hypothetical protein